MKNITIYFIILFSLVRLTLVAQNAILVQNQKLTITNLGGDNYTVGSNAELRISAPVAANGTLNLTSDSGWVILDGVLPSRAVILHLGYITVNGQKAVNNVNVRITNYLRGCVIMPHSPSYEALSLFKDADFAGDGMKCIPYKYYKVADLGSFDNTVSSFKLKKGYMATFAQNENGTGYSKVFIADKDDVEVSILQSSLNNEVSFVRVFPWRYTEKKGIGHGASTLIRTLRGSWFYNWGPSTNESTQDLEFVPTKWWAKSFEDTQWKTIVNLNNPTHLLGYNEPDGEGQANMTIDEQMKYWPKMLESGLRLGSPAMASDLNMLYEFFRRCDELNYRVDFAVIHDYRETTALQFYNKCKEVHDRTGRPIWIKEFNYGGTWTNGNPSYADISARIKEIIERYDKEGIIERYAIFSFNDVVKDNNKPQNMAVFYNTGTVNGEPDIDVTLPLQITPLGVVYRDQTSVMAFNPLGQINIPFKMSPPVNFRGSNQDGITSKLVWTNYINNDAGTFRVERSFNGGAFSQVAIISGSSNSYDDNVSASGYGIYTYRITAINTTLGNSSAVSTVVDVLANGKQNIARFKGVDASSTLSPNVASFAVDGNIVSDNSRWVNARSSLPATLDIDLNGFYFIDELVLYSGFGGYNSPITNFKFQYWSNNKWVDAVSETTNTASIYRKSFPEVKTNKLRLNVTASTDNLIRLYEIEVYGREDVALSIKDNQITKNQFSIYPNPTTNTLYISGNDYVKTFEIFDISGKKLITKKDEDTVDVSQLAAGIYFINVNNKEAFKFVKK